MKTGFLLFLSVALVAGQPLKMKPASGPVDNSGTQPANMISRSTPFFNPGPVDASATTPPKMISRRSEDLETEAGLSSTIADINREMFRRGRAENKPRQEDIDGALDRVRLDMARDSQGPGGFAANAFAASVGSALRKSR